MVLHGQRQLLCRTLPHSGSSTFVTAYVETSSALSVAETQPQQSSCTLLGLGISVSLCYDEPGGSEAHPSQPRV